MPSPHADPRSVRSEREPRWLWPVLGGVFLLATWLVYGRAADYPFLLDDVFHFRENPSVRSLGGLGSVWTRNYWEWYGAGGLYRPLLKTLWIGELALLGGGKATVLLTSAAGHAANASLVAWIARRAGAPGALAAAAGGWFLLHPAHGEVLLTGVGQGEIAGLLLGLAAFGLVLPVGDSTRGGRGRLAAAVGCGLAALLVKEQGFASLALVGAALVRNEAWSARERRAALAALGAGLAAVVALRFAVLGSFGPQGGFVVGAALGPGERLLLAPWLVGRYVALALAPVSLSADWSFLEDVLPVGPGEPLWWLGAAAAILSAALAVVWWRRGRQLPLLLLLAAWLPLAPFVGLVPTGSLFAERHAYHALAGAALLLAFGLARPTVPLAPRAAAGLVLLVAAGLGVRAFERVPAWESGERLWETTLRDHPRSYFAAASLAQLHEAASRVGPARAHAERALALRPDLAAAHVTLGNVALREGRPADALAHYRRAADDPVAGFDARVGAALAQLALGRTAEARAAWARLVEERPGDFLVRKLGFQLEGAERGRRRGEREAARRRW